jgi:O-antigen ligase
MIFKLLYNGCDKQGGEPNFANIMARAERRLLFIALFSIMIPLSVNIGPFFIVFFNIPLLLLAIAWFSRSLVQKTTLDLRLGIWDFSLFLFAGWICFTTLLTCPNNFSHALCWASLILIALYARHNMNKVFDYNFINKFALCALSLQGVIALLQFSTHSQIGSIGRYLGAVTEEIEVHQSLIRVEGTFPHANSLGMWIVILCPFVWAMMVKNYNKKKYIFGNIFLVFFLLCVCVLVISLSRWNLIVMLCTFLVFIFVRFLRTKKTPLACSVRSIFMVCLIGVALASSMSFFSKFGYLMTNDFSSALITRAKRTFEDSEIRLQQYKFSFKAIKHRPFLGSGFSNGNIIWRETENHLSLNYSFPRPHDIFLLLAVEGGMPALMLFCFITIAPLASYIQTFKFNTIEQDVLAMAVTAYLLAALIYLNAIQFWIWPLFLFLLGALKGSLSNRVFNKNC